MPLSLDQKAHIHASTSILLRDNIAERGAPTARGFSSAWYKCVVQPQRRLQSTHGRNEMLFMFILILQYNHSSELRVPSDRSPRLFIAFLFWSRQYDRQMQSGCNERRCYSEDGLLSPLNSSDRDIRRHYLCVRGKASNTCSLDKGQLFRRRQWCRAGGALL